MHKYEEKKFDIPELSGLSKKQIEEHLKLYSGYVKHVNHIREQIQKLNNDNAEENAYTISELRRRFSFEFNGMRMHEYYFEGFSSKGGSASGGEGGVSKINSEGNLKKILEEKYESFEGWLEHFKTVGMTRGIGWAVLYYDTKEKTPHTVWVGDHELGTLAGLPVLIAMDMWEHAFMIDYTPGEKKQYIEAFFNNLNWNVVEERFNNI